MLIQAQNQKEHQGNVPAEATTGTKESPGDEVKIKTESTAGGGDQAPSTDVEMTDLSDKVKMEVDEDGGEGAGSKSAADEDKPTSGDPSRPPSATPLKEINIDPKTYCKLGHFHLLLEDYDKGKRGPPLEAAHGSRSPRVAKNSTAF